MPFENCSFAFAFGSLTSVHGLREGVAGAGDVVALGHPQRRAGAHERRAGDLPAAEHLPEPPVLSL